jgi:hypothetical protein
MIDGRLHSGELVAQPTTYERIDTFFNVVFFSRRILFQKLTIKRVQGSYEYIYDFSR